MATMLIRVGHPRDKADIQTCHCAFALNPLKEKTKWKKRLCILRVSGPYSTIHIATESWSFTKILFPAITGCA